MNFLKYASIISSSIMVSFLKAFSFFENHDEHGSSCACACVIAALTVDVNEFLNKMNIDFVAYGCS